jgi:hypothetical protein
MPNAEAAIVNDENELGVSWITFQAIPQESAEYLELEWVVDQMWDLCRSDPERAWDTIQKIISLDHSDKILAMVGAGPFEDLMANHGTLLIDRVEACVRISPSFRRMLGVVWKNAIPDSVWDRLNAIAPPSW